MGLANQRLTRSTGRADSASKACGPGWRPAETMSDPRAATIAPLSVQRAGLGIRRRTPAFAHRSSATARRRELAATPPAMTSESIPVALHAANDFCSKTSTIDSWKDAATSAFA